MDFLAAAMPIALLIFMMTKRNPVPSALAFALAAGIAYVVRMAWFESPAVLLNAAVIAGLLGALTPISIVFGAILFFVAMEKSGAMDVLREWLRTLSPNPVAQLMIVGWAFQFLIEGASGFGTPAALAAPVLVGLGFPALRVAMLCLVMNSISVSFGAVGTPTWFGFGALNLDGETLEELAFKTAILQCAASLVIPVMALSLVVGWKEIVANAGFIYLSIAATVLPMLAVATGNDEFPTVVGGMVGLVGTIFLAHYGVGLARRPVTDSEPEKTESPAGALMNRRVFVALSPLLGTILVLLVTRIPVLGLRGWLTALQPNWTVNLGGLGEFSVSQSLVLSLRNILGENLNWSHAALYVPSMIPFVLTAGFALVLFRSGNQAGVVMKETMGRIRGPVLALLGALAFVQLLMVGGENSSTMVLGNALAGATGAAWIYFAPYLGALGSFFSGSATISNLTFGAIQYSIAVETGVSVSTLLALQSGGGAMGNMICIHNIVAVCAVLGLKNEEGNILKRTALPVLVYGLIFGLVVVLFF